MEEQDTGLNQKRFQAISDILMRQVTQFLAQKAIGQPQCSVPDQTTGTTSIVGTTAPAGLAKLVGTSLAYSTNATTASVPLSLGDSLQLSAISAPSTVSTPQTMLAGQNVSMPPFRPTRLCRLLIINLIYIAQFDTNGILTALYIVITYIQMQYVHVCTYAEQSYKYTYTCLHIRTYTVTCTNIHLPTY